MVESLNRGLVITRSSVTRRFVVRGAEELDVPLQSIDMVPTNSVLPSDLTWTGAEPAWQTRDCARAGAEKANAAKHNLWNIAPRSMYTSPWKIRTYPNRGDFEQNRAGFRD